MWALKSIGARASLAAYDSQGYVHFFVIEGQSWTE